MPRRIMKLSDDTLNSQLNAVKAMIRRAHKTEADSVDIEKELCWLEREQEMRELRQAIHKDYAASVQAQLEADLQEEREALKEYDEGWHNKTKKDDRD